jgi:hypothetical protein
MNDAARYTGVSMTTPLDQATTLLKDIASLPGAVLFSGVDTLVPGPLYVMGYNPGGPGEVEEASGKGTIGSSLKDIKGKTNWNDWADERYGRGQTYSAFQRNIRTVFEALGTDPRRTFSTNALFVRSSAADDLEKPWDIWWDTCWRVHQLFLDVVRPRVIVCLGNGGPPNTSTLEMLRLTRRREGQAYVPNFPAPGAGESARHGKWHPKVTFDLSDGKSHTCSVLGLPHPSAQPNAKDGAYWPLSSEATKKMDEARVAAVGWDK